MSAGFTIASERAEDGRTTLRIEGRLTLAEGHLLWQQLGAALPHGKEHVVVDLAGVHAIDGGAAALLVALRSAARARGGEVELSAANGDTAKLLELYAPPPQPDERGPPRPKSTLAQIGDWAYGGWGGVKRTLAFAGDFAHGAAQAVRRPRTVHLRDLLSLMERAGADGVPIVALINFLVGLILGLQGALQLHKYGGDTFLAQLVGLSVVRELGPLMTAILVTGRSGAAYAAELGTMTVNEEVDALRTLGQDPQRFLVFPRVLCLVAVMPLLTVIADFTGCLGGLAIALVQLEQPPVVYVQSLQRAVHLDDVATGLVKSVAFAILIALVSCQRGLATRGGAQGVGSATTTAVVVVLFGLVLIDTAFTWLFTLLGW